MASTWLGDHQGIPSVHQIQKWHIARKYRITFTFTFTCLWTLTVQIIIHNWREWDEDEWYDTSLRDETNKFDVSNGDISPDNSSHLPILYLKTLTLLGSKKRIQLSVSRNILILYIFAHPSRITIISSPYHYSPSSLHVIYVCRSILS